MADKVTLLTSKDLEELLALTPKVLPTDPTNQGWSAQRVKERFWLGYKRLFELLSRLAVESKGISTELASEITRSAEAEEAINARIDEAKANGYAKFDDLGNVIKDTYLMKRDLRIAQMVKSGDADPVSSDAVYAYLDDRGATDVEIMGIADWEE